MSAPRKKKSLLRLRWMPLFVLALGMLSVALMIAAERIGLRERQNYLFTDTIHEAQIELSKAHLIIDDPSNWNKSSAVAEVWQRVDSTAGMLTTMLGGGTTLHGHKVLPLTDQETRQQVLALGLLVSSFRETAGEIFRTGSPGAGMRLNGIFNKFLSQAFLIDEEFEKRQEQNDAASTRLFWGILSSWTVILFIATAGLWYREVQKGRTEEAILNAKREWENTFDVIPDLIAIIDRDHRIFRVNRAMSEKMGRQPQEILGQKCFEIFHGTSIPLAACPHTLMLQDGKVHTIELYEETLNAYYLVSVSPLYDDEGGLLGCVHVARDITAQKKTSETLKIKKSAIESAINAIGIAGLDGRITYVNPAFERLWGYSAEELLGRPVEDMTEEPQTAREIIGSISAREGWHGELTARKKDGSLFSVELSASLVLDDAGRPLCFMAAFNDITVRKKTEEELQTYKEHLEELIRKRTQELNSAIEDLNAEVLKHRKTAEALMSSEQQYRALSQEFNVLLDAIPDSLILMSADLRVLWANRMAIENLGVNVADITGQYCYSLWHSQKTPCSDCPVLKSFSSGKPEMAQISTPDGRLWATRAYPIRDEQGKVKSVMEISTDITEKMMLQAQRMRANHLASIGELAAGVAHEINNPINGIINYAQILRNKSEQDSRVHDISGRIIKEGERVSFIVKSLLSFARERKEEKVPVHVSGILSDTLALTEVHLKKNAIDISVHLPEGLPRIMAHPQQMQQVFLNIINNARYALNARYPHADPDKIFMISGEEKIVEGSRFVRLVFEDHGTGIPPESIGKVIEPFFTTKPLNIGTGLGLSISHGIIIDHGGKIDIESREGRYTRVVIHLPAYEE